MTKTAKIAAAAAVAAGIALVSAPPNPQCGVNSACVTISAPTDIASSGVLRPVASVYWQGRKIPFKTVSPTTLGPYAVSYTLGKVDSRPEVVLFAYK